MNRPETAAVLAMIASLDGRRAFGEADVVAWQAVLDDLRFEDCRDGVVAHYREAATVLMPSDLRERVRRVRKERIGNRVPPVPPVDPDDRERYARWNQAWTRAVGDGLDEAAAEAYADDATGITRQAIETRPRSVDYGSLARRPPRGAP